MDKVTFYFLAYLGVSIFLLWRLVAGFNGRLKKWNKKKKHCNKVIDTLVINIEAGKFGKDNVKYRPIFKVLEPSDFDKEIIIKSDHWFTQDFIDGLDIKVDMQVKLIVNPDDYSEFIYEDTRYIDEIKRAVISFYQDDAIVLLGCLMVVIGCLYRLVCMG